MANVLPSKIKYDSDLSLAGKVATLYDYADYIQEQVEWYSSTHHLSELYDLVNTAQATADEAVNASTTEEIVRKMEESEAFYTTGDVAVTQGDTVTFSNSTDNGGKLAVITFTEKYSGMKTLSNGTKVRVEGTPDSADEDIIFTVVAVDGGYKKISLRGSWTKTGETTGTVRIIDRTKAENSTNVDLKYRIRQAELKVTPEAITASVTSSKEWTNLGERVESAEASIASDSIQFLIKGEDATSGQKQSFSSALSLTSKSIDFLINSSTSGKKEFLSRITASSDKIKSLVQSDTAYSKLVQKADEVSVKVANANGELVTALNATPAGMKILADKIELDGYVQVTDLKGEGTTTINGANIKTGYIQDSNGNSYWNLDDGTLRTNAIEITGGTIDLGGFYLTEDAIRLIASENRSISISGASYSSGGDASTLVIQDGSISFNSNTCFIEPYASAGQNYDCLQIYAATETNIGNIGAHIRCGGTDAAVTVVASGGLRIKASEGEVSARVAPVRILSSASELPSTWTSDGIMYMVAE